MDIYDDSHLTGQKSDQMFISDKIEFRMDADEEHEIVFSPSESGNSILQRTRNFGEKRNHESNGDQPQLGQQDTV